jgi:thymidylate synthase (FAD)
LNTNIIAITKPLLGVYGTEYSEDTHSRQMDVEDFIAYVARVSNPSNQNNTLTAKKLLKYLAKNRHWSPFEMVNVVMEINTTRDIARQILRHRSFAFQEFSQRYADATQLGEFHLKETRIQDTKNRQNSVLTEDQDLINGWNLRQQASANFAKDTYLWALKNGIAKEQARAVLPEGMTPSRLYMNGTLRSWIHYCDLRMKNGTQKEHMDVAKSCWNDIVIYFPSLEEIFIGE